LLAESHFDLMISDVRMPGMSGLVDSAPRPRQSPSPARALGDRLRGYSQRRHRDARMGLNDLAKPIDLDELLNSVRLALNPGAAPALRPMRRSPCPTASSRKVRSWRRSFGDAAAVIAPSEQSRAHHGRKRFRQGSGR
jgi:DNA-binding response OmpR family regulator